VRGTKIERKETDAS